MRQVSAGQLPLHVERELQLQCVPAQAVRLLCGRQFLPASFALRSANALLPSLALGGPIPSPYVLSLRVRALQAQLGAGALPPPCVGAPAPKLPFPSPPPFPFRGVRALLLQLECQQGPI